jgi:hypothetical protein
MMQRLILAILAFQAPPSTRAPETLKVHGNFRSDMVLQRDKPVVVWGWAPEGTAVAASLGEEQKTKPDNAPRNPWGARPIPVPIGSPKAPRLPHFHTPSSPSC